jgi:glycine/D-amino acid oxidase-like deaminating enzyme
MANTTTAKQESLVAIVGAGVIGASWAAYFLARGFAYLQPIRSTGLKLASARSSTIFGRRLRVQDWPREPPGIGLRSIQIWVAPSMALFCSRKRT